MKLKALYFFLYTLCFDHYWIILFIGKCITKLNAETKKVYISLYVLLLYYSFIKQLHFAIFSLRREFLWKDLYLLGGKNRFFKNSIDVSIEKGQISSIVGGEKREISCIFSQWLLLTLMKEEKSSETLVLDCERIFFRHPWAAFPSLLN